MNRLALALALATAALLAACASTKPVAPAPAPAAAAAPARPDPGARQRADVLLAQARVLRAEGDLAGARGRLEAALEVAPGADDVRLELAELLVAEGRELPRAAALVDGVRSAEGDRRVALVLGQLAELRGDDAGAAARYARALALEGDPELRLRRALALERLGRADEATLELEAARRDRPADPVIRARLAERYEAAGLLAFAEVEWCAAAEAAPERAAGWERLARFYGRAGRPEQARAAEARAAALTDRKERALRPLPRSSR